MRVLYFTRDDSPHDRRFLAALGSSGHEIFSLRLEDHGRRMPASLPPGVSGVSWRGGRGVARVWDAPALLADLKRVLREVKPDVVHAGPLQNAAFLAACSGFQPLVSMSWGSDLLVDADRGPVWSWATRFTLARTKILLGDCRAVQEKAASLGFPAEKVVLFPWGVDLVLFSPGDGQDLRERWGWQDKFILLCNRSWEPIYGVDLVARAFVRAARVRPDLRLVLAGSGSQEKLLRSILEADGSDEVLDRVYFPGQISQVDLPQVYRAADLYVSASHSDGSSVSLLEAMACGKPVVVSGIPGNREWVTPEENGWLFPDGDAASLADRILHAAEQPAGRLSALGHGGRVVVEARADWSRNQRKLLEAYQRAMEA